MTSILKDMGQGLLSLLYPQVCIGCGEGLASQEEWICLECNKQLKPTDFFKYDDNPVRNIFYGRVNVNKAFSFYYMESKSVLNNLMHSIKYNGKKEAAVWLGKNIGEQLVEQKDRWDFIDLIVPVPLHHKRQKERGFNQSYYLAKGLGEVLKKPVLEKGVERVKNSVSQTKKNRMDRVENVQNIFKVAEPNAFKDKNVLLVDDVVTTGATAESCMQTILASGCKTINFVSLAMAI